MKTSKFMKALLVFGMSMVTATAVIGFTACGDEHDHVDADKDGKCDVCEIVMTTDGTEDKKDEEDNNVVKPAPKTEVTAEQWAQILESVNNFTLTQTAGGDTDTIKVDGDKVALDDDTIFVKDGEHYYLYYYVEQAEKWVKEEIEAEDYNEYVGVFGIIIKSFKDDYGKFTYANGKYTAASVDKTDTDLDAVLENIEVTFSDGKLVGVKCEVKTEAPKDEPNFGPVDGTDENEEGTTDEQSEELTEGNEGTTEEPDEGNTEEPDEGNTEEPEEYVTISYEIKSVGTTSVPLPTVEGEEQGGDTDKVDVEKVELNKTELTLNVDDEETLTATVTPDNADNKTVSWTSSDTSVATVDDSGKVTAVAAGTATITATADGKSATCSVTVNDPNPNPPIVLSAYAGEPIYGEAHDPDSDYIYHHIYLSDEASKQYDFDNYTATVKIDGVASDYALCQAFSAAEINDHSYHMRVRVKANRYQTVEITISFMKDGGVVATGIYTRVGDKTIELDKTTLNLKLTGETSGTITATLKNLEGTVVWSSSDESIATVDENGTVTAVAEGTATITATVGEISATCTVNVGEVQVPTVTDAKILLVYDNVHCGVILLGTDSAAGKYAEVASKFAYVKVNGTKNNDMKDMFTYDAEGAGSYRVNVFMGGVPQEGVDYVFEICDADGNVLLKTVALQIPSATA